MEKAIIVNRLVRDFEVGKLFSSKKKIIHALKSISFQIEQGELIGFIGPNGAGKTTTLKILSGLLYPTSGFTQVVGYDPWDRKPQYLKQISFVAGQKNQLWWDLPAKETFELNRHIYEIPKRQYEETLSELTKMLAVEKLVDIQVRRLSLGQRMKMELIAALLHRPKIMFLDEPTLGLDLVAQQKLRDFIYEYNLHFGATIILTSHNMGDLINLAKRVIVIDMGKIIFDGQFSELTEQFAKKKIIKLSLSQGGDVKQLENIGKIIDFSYPKVTLSVPRGGAAVAAAEILQTLPVADLTIEEVPIEDIVRKVFKGEYRREK